MTATTSASGSLVLVTGATGNQGGATARRLLAAGRPVRALVRDPSSPEARDLESAGAELVVGDLDEPSSVLPAVEGVGAVFAASLQAMGPTGPDHDREALRGRTVVDAAVASGVDQVVMSTVATSGSVLPLGKRRVEQYLRERIASPTVLRPVRFMSNYLAPPLGVDGIDRGVHRHLFPPHEPMQVIAVEDVAEFAALALENVDRFAGRTLELAGDQPTPVEAAALISRETGVDVRYEQLTEEQAASIGAELAQARERWLSGERWHADVEALRALHPGLRTLVDWLREGGAARIREQQAGRAGGPRSGR